MHPISPTLLLTMRNLLLLLLLFVLTPFTTKAQKLEFNGEFLLFREAKTKQPVLIINDSLVYKGNAMKRIAFKHTDYLAKLQEYDYFNIGKKTYLVHKGCGPVLEYRNDSIVRLNDNYLQRNQFDAVHFVYNNEIYFYGGYGLFTTKNILTKYNFKTEDWVEVQTYGEKAQDPRSCAYSYIKGEDLFVFGGGAKDINQITATKLSDNKVWKLHLPTMKWICIGKYNKDSMKVDIINVFNDCKNIYFHSGEYFLEIDYLTNKIYTYERTYFPSVLTSYIEGKTLVGVYRIESKTFFYIGNIKEFKGKLVNSTNFITPLVGNNDFLFILTVSILSIILLLFLFRKKIKQIIKPFKGIVFSNQKQSFLYKGKPILIFEEQEKKVLFYLLRNINQFVSLNELNQLFENSNQLETISATVKRREQTVSRLLAKISKITGLDEKELIQERKNIEDKRIKDLKILPNLLKLI